MKFSTVDAFKRIKFKNSVLLEGDLLRRYQLELLRIAEDIVSVCEEEKIIYHLTGGSALGAVRHGGFIPWDDDLDIDILGDDFDRFIIAFKKKYENKYQIHAQNTKEAGMTINRIRLKNSIARGREDIGNEECGFWIDVMRIENTPDNVLLRHIHGFLCLLFGFMLSCRNFYKNRKLMLALANENSSAKTVFKIKIAIGFMLSFMSVADLTLFTDKIYGLSKNENSKYVSVPSGRKHYFGELYLRSGFVDTVDMTFEGHKWKIPKDYDGYLKNMYNDYMRIPEENEIEKHIMLELKFPDNDTVDEVKRK